MSEYIGRINVSKDTMLFVVNEVFEMNIKASTTKEEILKIVPKMYVEENYINILKMLPYEAYKVLEKLVKYVEKSDDIKEFLKENEYSQIRYLEEIMVIVLRTKGDERTYSLNPGVIENLKMLFTPKNKELAEKYGEIEKLIIGLLYTYGVIEKEFFLSCMRKYKISMTDEEEIVDFMFRRLNLNYFTHSYRINWKNLNKIQTFYTYLDEYEEFDYILDGQKNRGFKYKECIKSDILKREEILWNDKLNKLYQFIYSNQDHISKYNFEKIIKRSEKGENVFDEILNMCSFEDENSVNEFLKLYMDWYNNSSQYCLCGYSPIGLQFKNFLN